MAQVWGLGALGVVGACLAYIVQGGIPTGVLITEGKTWLTMAVDVTTGEGKRGPNRSIDILGTPVLTNLTCLVFGSASMALTAADTKLGLGICLLPNVLRRSACLGLALTAGVGTGALRTRLRFTALTFRTDDDAFRGRGPLILIVSFATASFGGFGTTTFTGLLLIKWTKACFILGTKLGASGGCCALTFLILSVKVKG